MSGSSMLRLLALVMVAFLSACGGGGGGDSTDTGGGEKLGVFSGFSGQLDWAGSGGDSGVGPGASGDGGIGAGGDFGQFLNTLVVVKKLDGTLVGQAKTDATRGMVTIYPGAGYSGPLLVELHGGDGATYYEEGKNEYVPLPAGQVIRAIVPRLDKNIGITLFTDAAYRLLTEGSTPERVSGTPSAAQIEAANVLVGQIVNQQVPAPLQIDDITRLPFIKSKALAAGSISIDPGVDPDDSTGRRGRYGLVSGAFSKQAAVFNPDDPAPTLSALKQLGEDLLDGRLDGLKGSTRAVDADKRTYDPHTLAGELSSTLAQQTARFGTTRAALALPSVLNYGNSRYEGYLFDATLGKDGVAATVIAGWVGADPGKFGDVGTARAKLQNDPTVTRVIGIYGNFGHGSVFLKVDADDSKTRLFAVGDNASGELGNGQSGPTAKTGGAAVPITLPGPLTHIAGGFGHTVARLADGSVYAWGDNSFSQLGQGADTANHSTPVKVTLPAKAVAVAASYAASYALLEDGQVYAWGSGAGFGLLGDGNRDSVAATPQAVSGLANIVQIAARDNDAMALRADGSIFTWGSFPSAPTTTGGGFTPGNVAAPYNGGSFAPTAVNGIPKGTVIRKILTEQGLFAALDDTGAVWTWGVYFDITASNVLYDLGAVQVRSLPKVRDLMPGGFIGYGQRPFDRLTAMAVDYDGNLFKIRGRIAEQFDATSAESRKTQRRPVHLDAPPQTCDSCHSVITGLDHWPVTAPAGTVTAGVCTNIPPAIKSLVHSDTRCELCHNSESAKQSPVLNWLNCSKPTDLPLRTRTDPPSITATCAVPAQHPATPPGLVCTSCHNSVIARPLSCNAPAAGQLATLRTTAAIASASNDAGTAIAPGASTADNTPTLRGTLSAPLAAGETLSVLRGGTAEGVATVTGTAWAYTGAAVPDGTQNFTVRVVSGAAFGPSSAPYSVVVRTQATAATITGVTGNGSAVAEGGATADPRPVVSGSLASALIAGETLTVLRDGAAQPATALTVTGTTWRFAEPADLAPGSYSYLARVTDSLGNTSSSVSRGVVVAALASPAIAGAFSDANAIVAIPAGGTRVTTPTLAGTLSSPLLGGQTLTLLRNGSTVGPVSTTGTAWRLTDPAAVQGVNSYVARVTAGSLVRDSAAVAVLVDSLAPTNVAAVTSLTDANLAQSVAGGTSINSRPTVGGTLGAALATAGTVSAESLKVVRTDVATNAVAEFAPSTVSGTTWSYTPAVADALTTGHTYRFAARVDDAAGNAGPVTGASLTVTIDTNQRAASITAVTGGGAPINVVPTISGAVVNPPLVAGQSIRVLRDGAGIGTATVAVNGLTWTFTDSLIPAGSHSYTAAVVTGGTQGAQSAPFSLLYDNTAPAAPLVVSALTNFVPFDNSTATVVAPGAAVEVGSFGGVRITTDVGPFIVVKLPAALAGAGTASAESLVFRRNGTEIGRLAAGAATTACPASSPATGTQVCYRVRDTSNGVISGAVPGAGLTAPTAPVVTGSILGYSAEVADAAGNTSTSASLSLNFRYLSCNLARARIASPGSHAGFTTATACVGCHTHQTVSGVELIAAPANAAPTYWCRLPQIDQ